MAIEQKYGRVTVERGTIGEGEPVFVIRAQDALACPAVSAYYHLCVGKGAGAVHLSGVEAACADWQEANPGRVKEPG